MLKKSITFKDLDGNDITEDFYFNLSKAEIAEMELSHKDGLSDYLQKIIADENGAEIIKAFKDIIAKAIGKRSEDGRRFIKNQEITEDFMQTDAYNILFMELVTDANAAAEWIAGIVPAEMQEAVKAGEPARVTDLQLPEPEEPAWIRENRDPTQAELREMSPEELQEAFRRKNSQG
jgi:hypothetical protein